MTKSIPGSCLCGAVRFEIRGSLERFFLCHCRRCQKDTGTAHAANLFSATAGLAAKDKTMPSTINPRLIPNAALT